MANNPSVAKDRVLTSFPKPVSSYYTPYKSLDFDPIVKSACQRDRTNIGVQLCKAVIVGDVAVGKTSLITRFCHDVFDRDYKATIGVDFEVEKFYVLSLPFTLQLWDTAGHERFRCIASSYYRGANVAIVAFDLSDIKTLHAARMWHGEVMNSCPNPLIFLVGMKKDMLSSAAYSSTEAEAMSLAEQIGAEYWATSSKTGENIKEFFFRVAALTFNHLVSAEMSSRHEKTSKSIGNNLVSIKSKDLYEKKRQWKCTLL